MHKEFNLITKLIDLWVEPAMYMNGHDLYNRGGNLALSNLTYLVLNSLLPEKIFKKMLKRFQVMMRERTKESYSKFWQILYDLYYSKNDKDDPIAHVIVSLLGGEINLGFNHLLEMPPKSLDVALSCSLATIQHFRKNNEGPFTIIHDNSSAMAKEKWLWDIIVNPNVPNRIFSDEIYPLNVTKTIFADSKDYIQLQFADLLAGASAAFYKSKLSPHLKSDYTEALEKAGIMEFLIGGIWPSN